MIYFWSGYDEYLWINDQRQRNSYEKSCVREKQISE